MLDAVYNTHSVKIHLISQQCCNDAVWIFPIIHKPLDKKATILADDIFKCIFVNENDRISNKIPLKFVPRNPIDTKLALVRAMAWHRTGNKPLNVQIMFLTHYNSLIWVWRPGVTIFFHIQNHVFMNNNITTVYIFVYTAVFHIPNDAELGNKQITKPLPTRPKEDTESSKMTSS